MEGKLVSIDRREDGKFDFILQDSTGSIVAVNGCKELPDAVLNGVGTVFTVSINCASEGTPNLVSE